MAVPPSLKPSSHTSRQQPSRCRRRSRRRRQRGKSLPSPALLLVVHGRALIYMFNCAFAARRSSEHVAPRLRPGRALVVRTRLRGALVLLISTQAAARGRAAVAKALVRDVEAAAKSLPTPKSQSTPAREIIFTFAGPSSGGHGRALIYTYNCAFPARRSSERVAHTRPRSSRDVEVRRAHVRRARNLSFAKRRPAYTARPIQPVPMPRHRDQI